LALLVNGVWRLIGVADEKQACDDIAAKEAKREKAKTWPGTRVDD